MVISMSSTKLVSSITWQNVHSFNLKIHTVFKVEILSLFITLMLFQNCLTVFLLQSTKDDILKHVRNQKVLVTLDPPQKRGKKEKEKIHFARVDLYKTLKWHFSQSKLYFFTKLTISNRKYVCMCLKTFYGGMKRY